MDLAEITDFIARDNPVRAFEFEEELVGHARKIGRAPLAMRNDRICATDCAPAPTVPT